MAELLEFEEPIGVLLKEIEAISMLPATDQRRQDIARLEQRIISIRADLYDKLTPWQRVLVARHPARQLNFFLMCAHGRLKPSSASNHRV